MILDKLTQPNAHLDRDDLTPNQKKHLWSVMMKYQASQGFAYDRFFKEGFREWELRGVDNIKRDFIREYEAYFFGSDMDRLLSDERLKECIEDSGDSFYEFIGRYSLKLAFCQYMQTLGMGANAVLERFGKQAEKDFKLYERVGIRAVIREFEKDVSELKIA